MRQLLFILLMVSLLACNKQDYTALMDEEISLIDASAPGISILRPLNNENVALYSRDGDGNIVEMGVELNGIATCESGEVISEDYRYSWMSNIDGFLGNGRRVILENRLTPGMHEITLAVSDQLIPGEKKVLVNVPGTHSETFSTTTFIDWNATTGRWNTALGKAHLGPHRSYAVSGAYSTRDSSSSTYYSGVAIAGKYAVAVNSGDGILDVFELSMKSFRVVDGARQSIDSLCGVAYVGAVCCAISESLGMVTIDMANPMSPVKRGELKYSGSINPTRVSIQGQNAFITDAQGLLVIVSITDLANPVVCKTVALARPARDVSVSGQYAYVANDVDGLLVCDVSDPMNPIIAGTFSTSSLIPAGRAISVVCDNAMVSLGMDTGEVVIINVAEPSSPSLLGIFQSGDAVHQLAAQNGFIYIANNSLGMTVVDAGDPVHPHYAGSSPNAGSVVGIAVSTDYSIVAESNHRVACISLRVPSAKVAGTSIEQLPSAFHAVPVGSQLFVSRGIEGYSVVSLDNMFNPVTIGQCDVNGASSRSIVKDDYAYLVEGSTGLVIVDMHDPENPVILSTFATAGPAQDVAVSGNYAFIAELDMGIRVVDISDPLSPQSAAWFNTPGLARGVAISGNYLYVADSGNGLIVLDVSDPLHPSMARSYPSNRKWSKVVVSGSRAYLSSDMLSIFDVSVPDNPQLLGQCSISLSADNDSDIIVLEDDVYCLPRPTVDPRSTSQYLVIDAHNASAPSVLQSEKMSFLTLRGVSAQKNYVYVATDNDGIQIYGKVARFADLYNDTSQEIIQSVPVVIASVRKARLYSSFTLGDGGSVHFEVSNDGVSWYGISDGGLVEFPTTSNGTLQWRARLQTSMKYSSPMIDQVVLEYWN